MKKHPEPLARVPGSASPVEGPHQAAPGDLRCPFGCASGWAGAAGRSTGEVSTSNKSLGVHPNAVHNGANVDSLTWEGSLLNSATPTPRTTPARRVRPTTDAAGSR